MNGTPTPPKLLNDDGTASIATMLLLSHHAFRRDITRFIRAIQKVKEGDISHVEALREEWKQNYKQALHGHHTIEDSTIFPDIRNKNPELGVALDTLTEQHHHIDPLLERGDEAFKNLAEKPEEVERVLIELKRLLDEHLTFEEAQITPSLRDSKEFPTPADDTMANMYAQGFAWSMQGIAPNVLDEVRRLLPEVLLSRLSSAQEEFETRSKKVWGEYEIGSAVTPLPSGY